MIGSFHVQLNGVKYRLAEDAEGQHYRKHRENLRAPTNAVVQGESGKFQLRPDLQEWKITDFSGGEGRLLWTDEAPGEYYRGFDIDPFRTRGTLQLAKKLEVTQDNTGTSDFAKPLILATEGERLVGIDISDVTYGTYLWDDDNEKWGAIDADTETTPPPAGVFAFGGSYYTAWAVEDGGTPEDVIRKQQIAAVGPPSNHKSVAEQVVAMSASAVGNYFFYAADKDGGLLEVFEIETPIDATPTAVQIYGLNHGSPGNTLLMDQQWWPTIAVSTNAAYLVAHYGNLGKATLHKIEPTTSAAAGSGEQVAELPGFTCHAMWYHLGLLFLAGRMGDRSIILYYDEVNQTFGVLADMKNRDHAAQDDSKWIFSATEPVLGFQSVFLHLSGPDDEDDQVSLMVYDAVSGGIAGTSVYDPGAVTRTGVKPSLVVHRGEVFFHDDGADKIIRQLKDEWTTRTGIYESAINDFDIVDDKVLLSILCTTEPLPANSSVVVKYQLDQDGTWHTAGTMDTTNQTEERFLISTDSVTRTFSNLQIRLELSNGGTSTETPEVRSIQTRSTVAKGVNVWDLLLKADDELGQMQNRSWNGATLISNIETAGDTEQVVALLDGYKDRSPKVSTEYDVIIDDYEVMLERAGEGVVRVRLREVQ